MSGGTPRSSRPCRPRVLVADDEGALRRFIVRSLSRTGFEVVEAADGLQAARFVEAGAFDVIVSDVLMPGMDGLELLRVVRQCDPWATDAATPW